MPRAKRTSHQVIVIGAGVAGLAAALEAARCGLKTNPHRRRSVGRFDHQCGGAAWPAGTERNRYRHAGAEFVNRMLSEALEADVDYRFGAVTELTAGAEQWRLPGHEVSAGQVILATGAELRPAGHPRRSRTERPRRFPMCLL